MSKLSNGNTKFTGLLHLSDYTDVLKLFYYQDSHGRYGNLYLVVVPQSWSCVFVSSKLVTTGVFQ